MKYVAAKVKFLNQEGEFTEMLFGGPAMGWAYRFDEYRRMHKLSVIGVETSDQPWISYGGVKWCHPTALQEELDKEGKGRQASDFIFKKLSRGDLKPYVS